MNKTNKSSMMIRLVSVLAVTLLFTMCFVGGTFAKYKSSATGTDSATVAKWEIEVGGTNIAQNDSFTFNLFDTIKDTGGVEEADVSPIDGTIIAPGTMGSFVLTIQNKSQVTAKYSVEFSVTNANNIPVEFSADGATWVSSIATLNVTDAVLNIGSEAVTVPVYWRWAFYTSDAQDSADTSLGAAGTASITVTANVTATQVD
ncbi:MAG: hypothetical protein ACI4M6_06455 [Christensenellaceae bacterium]